MRKRIKWLFPLLLALNMGVQAAILQQYSHSEPSVSQTPGGIWEAPDRNGGFIGVNLWEVPASLGHGGPAPKTTNPIDSYCKSAYTNDRKLGSCVEKRTFSTQVGEAHYMEARQAMHTSY